MISHWKNPRIHQIIPNYRNPPQTSQAIICPQIPEMADSSNQTKQNKLCSSNNQPLPEINFPCIQRTISLVFVAVEIPKIDFRCAGCSAMLAMVPINQQSPNLPGSVPKKLTV